MKILDIKREDRRRRRWLIRLDDGRNMNLSEEILQKYSLTRGAEISEERMQTLSSEDMRQSALEKAIELLSFRDHSCWEMSDKLKKRSFPDNVIEQILLHLKEKAYLDDEKFTAKLLDELTNIRQLGPLLVKKKLFEKGLPPELISSALESIPDDSWQRNCKYHFKMKKKKLRDLSEKKNREKMIRFLMQKGFYYDLIQPLLANVLSDGYEPGDQ